MRTAIYLEVGLIAFRAHVFAQEMCQSFHDVRDAPGILLFAYFHNQNAQLTARTRVEHLQQSCLNLYGELDRGPQVWYFGFQRISHVGGNSLCFHWSPR